MSIPMRGSAFHSVTLFIGFGRCEAGLVSVDDAFFGTDSVTLDTDTGLEWLDLLPSTNCSFNQVATNTCKAGGFAGWRHATEPEIRTFWTNAGLVDISSTRDATDLNAVLAVQSLVGTNWLVVDLLQNSSGYYDDGGPGGLVGRAQVTHWFFPSETTEDIVPDNSSPDFIASTNGSWLVRTASVPESTTSVLLIGALMSLTAPSRRTKAD